MKILNRLKKQSRKYCNRICSFTKYAACSSFLILSACTSLPTPEEITAKAYEEYGTTPMTINNVSEGRKLLPIYEAVKRNDNEAVKIFLQNPRLNLYIKPSVLIRAAYNGNIEMVSLLLERGVRVNEQNHHGETALIIATRKQHARIVEMLLEAGAKTNIQNNKGTTALMKAVLSGNTQVTNLLLKAGADRNIRNNFNRTALIYASAKNHEEIALELIQPGLDLDVKDKKGNTALIYAAQNGSLKILQKLIQNGARVELNDKDKTALKLAAMKGHTNIVKSLIQANTKDF